MEPSKPFDHEMPEKLHRAYVRLTGLAIAWGTERRYAWELYCLRFTEDDLKTVIAFIKEQKAKRRPARSLMFRSLIAGPGSLAYSEEDLAEARATKRVPVVDAGKAAVMKATGRNTEVASTVRTAAQIIAGNEALAQFRKLRDEL